MNMNCLVNVKQKKKSDLMEETAARGEVLKHIKHMKTFS